MTGGLPLPHGLARFAEVVGVEPTLKLAMARGGSRFRVPLKAEGSILADIIGIDDARRIVEALGNERIEIPLGSRVLSVWLRGRGWSQERRAVALRVTRRTIQIWDGGKTETQQPDLFADA